MDLDCEIETKNERAVNAPATPLCHTLETDIGVSALESYTDLTVVTSPPQNIGQTTDLGIKKNPVADVPQTNDIDTSSGSSEQRALEPITITPDQLITPERCLSLGKDIQLTVSLASRKNLFIRLVKYLVTAMFPDQEEPNYNWIVLADATQIAVDISINSHHLPVNWIHYLLLSIERAELTRPQMKLLAAE